jgi:hypothetical protein
MPGGAARGETQNLRISLLDSLLAGKCGAERGLLETASTTNQHNKLDRASVHRRNICVMVCVTTLDSCPLGERFEGRALGLHADVTIPL